MACVQCGGKFEEGNSCSFHLSNETSRSGVYNCCGKATGCVLNMPHSQVHHCKFAYSKFIPYARAITGYTDTTEEFGSVKLDNLDDGTSENASVSQLLRYVSKVIGERRGQRTDFLTFLKGNLVKDQNLLLVHVGCVWPSYPYFFHVFTESELDAAARSNTALIFRTSAKTDQYAQASWIFKDQLVAGVRLECKVSDNCFFVSDAKTDLHDLGFMFRCSNDQGRILFAISS